MSEEAKKNVTEEQPEAEEPQTAGETPEEEKPEETGETETKDETAELKAAVADLEKQVAALKNAYAMAYADTENTRKRLSKEFDQNMKYHIQGFALDILPVIDNCERALAVKPKDTEDENYRKAFEMVLKQLTAALKKEGVEEIEALGQPYDANWMQAMMTEAAEGVEPGTVTMVLQKGYKLKDRLLRAAMVKVSE
ncbi:MAG: nucleotide exchange factor GrpE [Solobacterium sp.]|nr:nucleotide exchange factor GrpE [Solobacterium sp.]